MDLNGALAACFDEDNNRIRVVVVDAALGALTAKTPDANGAISRSFDGSDELRVVFLNG